MTRDEISALLDADGRDFLDRIACLPPVETMDVRALRLAERVGADPADRSGLSVWDDRHGVLPLRVYRPEGHGGGMLLFLHGGGFALGDLDTHDALCAALARHSGTVLVAAAYRLAPEHPYPAQWEDAVASLAWLRANAAAMGCDPRRLGVAGDSAGGNLAANLALHDRDARRAGVDHPPLAFQALLYPLTHREHRVPSEEIFARGCPPSPAMTARMHAWHRPDPTRRFPYDGPFEATDHRDLAPGLVALAACDPLRDHGAQYAARLRAAGVAMETTVYPGTLHGFLQHDGAASRLARREIGAAIGRALAPHR